ncbi:phosphate acetyltransferase [Candidatus Peregrinibacteria bacterium CG11_big_fil_rev_8_21_14_0_20_46_8]|nr:MAG: phosphate acetyltransferase [Candidatus Peregrinibacteria bacterium CG11_big_fil_rev_8_21_14_0_20_46_8]
MLSFLQLIRRSARQYPARIIFPESEDERVLAAVAKIAEEETARSILVGNQEKIVELGRHSGVNLEKIFDRERVQIFDPAESERMERYVAALVEKRKNKGMTAEKARERLRDPNYFGVMAVELGDADGMISGAVGSTGGTLRPAFQIIKTKEKFHKVSGFFFMVLEGRLLLFADCAVNIEPNSHELADIAMDTAETARRFGLEPRIAMLSFSTMGSADHPRVDKVREATAMVQHHMPDVLCEGEMQVDAALVPEVAARKCPKSKLAGRANILIFPNLEAANIAYKLVERLAGAQAIGPILQGLKKPVNDLSRGCSVDDIVNLAAITSVEAAEDVVVPQHLIAN